MSGDEAELISTDEESFKFCGHVEKPSKIGAELGVHKFSRLRLSWKKKATVVFHYNRRVPRPTLEQISQGCKSSFKLDRALHITAIALWLKKRCPEITAEKIGDAFIQACARNEIHL